MLGYKTVLLNSLGQERATAAAVGDAVEASNAGGWWTASKDSISLSLSLSWYLTPDLAARARQMLNGSKKKAQRACNGTQKWLLPFSLLLCMVNRLWQQIAISNFSIFNFRRGHRRYQAGGWANETTCKAPKQKKGTAKSSSQVIIQQDTSASTSDSQSVRFQSVAGGQDKCGSSLKGFRQLTHSWPLCTINK